MNETIKTIFSTLLVFGCLIGFVIWNGPDPRFSRPIETKPVGKIVRASGTESKSISWIYGVPEYSLGMPIELRENNLVIQTEKGIFVVPQNTNLVTGGNDLSLRKYANGENYLCVASAKNVDDGCAKIEKILQ